MPSQPPPLNIACDRNGGQMETQWKQWFQQLFSFLTASVIDYTMASVQVPLTGFTIQIADKSQVLTLDPAGTLATGTIKLPANPYDGQPIQITSTSTITSLTLSSAVGTIKNGPSTLLAGSSIAYFYHASNKTWYRLS